MPDQSWVEEWQVIREPLTQEDIEWIRSRPAAVQLLMRRFPPACLVRAIEPLTCPAPGTFGFVASYFEDGTLTVCQHPDTSLRAECEPAWLHVVGYYHGLTPERVATLLEGLE